MESEGYIRLKADASISSKERMKFIGCGVRKISAALKSRSFSDSVVANLSRYNLEHTNKITNSAGRRVWGFMGIEAVARPNINGFYRRFAVYVRWRNGGLIFLVRTYTAYSKSLL